MGAMLETRGINAESDESGNGARSSQRRQVPFMRFPSSLLYWYWDDMDNDLEKLEDQNFQGETMLGPFGCFAAVNRYKSDLNLSRPVSLATFSPSISNIINNRVDEKRYSAPIGHSWTSRSHKGSYLPAHMNALFRLSPISTTPSSPIPSNISVASSRECNDEIIPRKIWIHPRFNIDASLTYKVLLGDANAEYKTSQNLQKVVFSDYYGTTDELHCRIVDKFEISDITYTRRFEIRLQEAMEALKIHNPSKESQQTDFQSLLKASLVHDLLRLFVKTSKNLFFLSFKGSILDTLVIPMVYKAVGELLIGSHGTKMYDDVIDESDEKDQEKNRVPSRLYCIILHQSLILLALSIASFNQYSLLFNSFGTYQGSLDYLKCCIAFREISLMNLARIIIPLIGDYSEDEPIIVLNRTLLDKLVSLGLAEELLVTLILAIKQDESLNIILNYKLLYAVLQGVREYFIGLQLDDSGLESVLVWSKYMYFFYFATATIDVAHYQIKEPGFEDLNENYNLIENFQFDDSFEHSEYAKIEINAHQEKSKGEEEDEQELERATLPKRLANRPPVEDKPPRSFTVKFRFNEEQESEDGGYEGESSGEDAHEKSSSSFPWRSLNEKTIINHNGDKVSVLTGLSIKPSKKILKEELLKTGEMKQIDIKVPFEVDKTGEISSLEISYGIPTSLLDLMIRTVTISNHKNWFQRKKAFPRNFPKFCCDLEEDLMTWKLPWNLYSQDDVVTNKSAHLKFHSLFHETLHNLIFCFYNSILMFFFRIIKDTDPSLLQDYVESTLYHLEELQRISLDPEFSKKVQISLPFWCFFICGSDAVSHSLQSKYDNLGRIWSGVGDKWIGKQMVMEIWRGRNYGISIDEQMEESDRDASEEDKETSWLDMIKGWEMSGFH
ncbi:hypothetical protein FOA43_002334 [Brettanomyces nanus]|uniref:Uncharacterized protein n=1 Tax=Eeniella nana TaxID=13502 RepID=A0A875S740_EENNA|nr:uncharacterized protein FOA43_002334 [Brettanomyces nanus]QPG74994.1 hypothetical protein FOA43_002334 [Brettanomyces nanus]